MKKAVAARLALTVFLSLFSAFSVFSAAAWDESEIFTSGDGCWQYYLREEDDKAVIMGTVEEPGETVTSPAEIDGHKVAAVGLDKDRRNRFLSVRRADGCEHSERRCGDRQRSVLQLFA